MEKFESRIGRIIAPKEQVYNFLCDFNNFKELIPENQITNWESDHDTCSFSIGGMGEVGLKIIEKEPHDLIKITGSGMARISFFLWIQLLEDKQNNTRVKITLKADLNPMVKMVASKPLKQFLEILVSHMEKFSFVK